MPGTTQSPIALCTPETYDAFLAFSAKHNSAPEQHCLLTDVTPEGVKADLEVFGTDPFTHWWGYTDPATGELAALAGLDVDFEHNSAFVQGPWGVDAKALAIVLREAIAAAPAEIEVFKTWHNVSASTVTVVLNEYGFKLDKYGTCLEMRKPSETLTLASLSIKPAHPTTTVSIIPLDDNVNRDLAGKLHTETFETAAFHLDEFPTLDGTTGWLFGAFDTAGESPVLCGYAIVRRNNTPESAYLDYVGIAPEFRAKGRGTVLLNAIKKWFIEEDSKTRLDLTVNGDNIHAKKLYVNVGFEVTEEGVAYKFLRGEAAKKAEEETARKVAEKSA
ncbi:hypothetical protein DFJ77DRAFT_469638 [Powellomyces hirtus]|nr:hypothetical protein DFJ77DRAFT_469638 [Powellomyces hirtus]